MLRRRVLKKTISILPVTLSSYSYSATPASGTKTVTAYYGGVPISDLTSSMVSKSGNMSSVSVNSSGQITMSYYSNTSTSSTATSTMTLTYQGQTKTFTITQAKDYAVSTENKTLSTCDSCGEASTPLFSVTVNNGVYTNSAFTAKVGATYDLNWTVTTYASGNTSSSEQTKSNIVYKYVSVGAGELPISSVASSVNYHLHFSSSKSISNSENYKINIRPDGYVDIGNLDSCSGTSSGYFICTNVSTQTYRYSELVCGI